MSAMAPLSEHGVCPDCGGPSRSWKGSHHAWRCTSCVNKAIRLDVPPRRRLAPRWPAIDINIDNLENTTCSAS